jgi:hypothetical protein
MRHEPYLLTTFLELCNPFSSSLSSVPSEEDRYFILNSEFAPFHSAIRNPHLAMEDGVAPFFFYRTRSISLPAAGSIPAAGSLPAAASLPAAGSPPVAHGDLLVSTEL